MSQDETKASADETRQIGRGALYLTVTKFWFMISGYVIYFGLPRLLGGGEVGKELFGKYQVVTGLGAIFNALVVQGTTQAVSRFVGRDPENGDGVRRAAYLLQAGLGGGLFALIYFLAPWWATEKWGDPELIKPLRCAALILLFYAFYAVAMGYLNGRRLFARQALADFLYSTVKVVGVLGGAYFLKESLGPVTGPVLGFAAAAGFVMILAYVLCGRAKGPGQTSPRELLVFQSFTMAFTFCSTWIARGDLQILRTALADDEGIDVLAAEYASAQAFAAIPYMAVFAITFVLFPLVSGVAGRDDDKLRLYVRQTTRYAALIACMIGGLFISCPERTITILFPADYSPAAMPLQVLSLGYVAYSLFFIMCAIITASGKPQVSLGLVVIVVAIQVGLGLLLVDAWKMMGVATGSAIGMGVGMLLTHGYLTRKVGQGIEISGFLRTLLSGVVIGGIAHVLFARSTVWGGSGLLAGIGGTGIVAKLVTVVGFGVLSVVFIVLLFVTGVLTSEDKSKFLKVFKRG